MMKKLLCALLALTLLCAPAAVAAGADEAQPAITIDYDELAVIVAGNSPAVRSVLHSYQQLALSLADLERRHGDLMDGGLPLEFSVGQAATLQSAIKDLRLALRDADRDINRAAGGQLYAARLTYLGHYALLEQADIILRGREAALRDVDACRKKLEMGLVSQSVLDMYEKAVTAWNDAEKELRRAADDNLASLADLLGITVPMTLGGLPEIDIESIPARDPAADLAAYTLSAPDVQAKKIAMDDARRALEKYADSNTAPNRHAYEIAKEDYERAQAAAVRDFPRIYQKLLDAYTDYIDSTAVKDAEKELDKLQKRFAAGLASQSGVTAAARALEDAKSEREQARINLCLTLLEYEYGLINWV